MKRNKTQMKAMTLCGVLLAGMFFSCDNNSLNTSPNDSADGSMPPA
jgi:hypothetical protein